MTRPLFLGNGRMLVGINKFGLVHDFYYPYVGLENHTASPDLRHKIGVWVEGNFSWLDDGNWDVQLDYEEDAMVGMTFATNQRLDVRLEFHDFVDSELNVFGRNIHIINTASHEREIRLFVHQVFQIAESARGDTALYIPDDEAILDYKGNRAFVIYGQHHNGSAFDQYSIGNFGIEGKEGTFRDAEDGNLEKNNVEHGHVDSVLRFSCTVAGHNSARVHYWIAAASNNVDALSLHRRVLKDSLEDRMKQTRTHWHDWLSESSAKLHRIDKKYLAATKKSLFIIKSHIDHRGAVIASGDSQMLNYARDYYSYCWPRDAAFVILPLLRMGYKKEAENWFEFARDVLTDDGYLMHKYLPDRSIGSSWHPYVHEHHQELPIQEDETAITIWLLGQYLEMGGDEDFARRMYRSLVKPAAEFIEGYIDAPTRLPHASYDLWEERFQTTTYSTGVVYAALKAAAEMAERFQHPDDAIRWEALADEIKVSAKTLFNENRNFFYRGYLLGENGMLEFDEVIDVASLFGAYFFGLFDETNSDKDKVFAAFDDALLDVTPSGGVPRYENDNYNLVKRNYLGNPWFVATLWRAQLRVGPHATQAIENALDWTQSKMLKSAVLPEQIDPETSEHVSVSPLIWSHAEFVNTVLLHSDKK